VVVAVATAYGAGPKWVGSKVCAGCHPSIYQRYSVTPMATSSGTAGTGSLPERFDHSTFSGSGYQYSVTRDGEAYILGMRKQDGSEPAFQRRLRYFAGSGTAARSFLIDIDGFLYEAPATYYSASGQWNFSPGYGAYSYPFLTRAITPGCLDCHASGVRPIAGTQNGYESPPFLEGGAGCERCHGPGGNHVRSAKAGNIVNPAKLERQRRDSVCEQCHLSGEIRVERAGKSQSDFVAGEKLPDYTVAFVRASSSPRMKVTSHVENLAQSACKRASSDRMWCGTCHDPHFAPAGAERVAWFRSKCLTCHTTRDCKGQAATRTAAKDDCTACHMPRGGVSDAEHVVYTDHSIPRRPIPRNERAPAAAELIPFGGKPVDPRDLGLAYAIVAIREGNAVYRERAFTLLLEAEKKNPDDPQTLSYLADLYKGRKEDREATRLYEKLLRVDPTQSSAPVALGAYQMEQGHYEEAIRLWTQALRISPALVLVRLNTAVAMIRIGHRDEARAMLRKALEFNPSFDAARKLLATL
jgi:tetratricopeptide (TPR) repeat protein